jgi:rhodanese-related sulfurtransferase
MITPAEARRRLDNGSAVLVDIREPMEHARESIPGALLHSVSVFDPAVLRGQAASALIFHCQSGKRTCDIAERLLACGAPETFILQGGLQGWKAAGHATTIDRSKPIELQRQVQIAAGTLVVLGLLLAWLVTPLFLGVTAFVGAGLIFAGFSGWCGMAHLLGFMPWNRIPA